MHACQPHIGFVAANDKRQVSRAHAWVPAPRRIVIRPTPEHALKRFLFSGRLIKIRRKQMSDRTAGDAGVEIFQQWTENSITAEFFVRSHSDVARWMAMP